MVVAREDLALEAAFWAQLPGNFAFRPRKAPITSRNFAGLAPLHNFPVGRAAAITGARRWRCSKTSAHSPYYFSLHASDPREADGGARRDTGHTFICGPTGSGKTVFLGFCVAMLAKLGATPGDLRQGSRARDPGAGDWAGGIGRSGSARRPGSTRSRCPRGRSIGSSCRAGCTRSLASAGRALTVREEADLEQALAGTLALPRRRGGCRGWWSFSMRPMRRGCTRGSRAGARRRRRVRVGVRRRGHARGELARLGVGGRVRRHRVPRQSRRCARR